MPDKKSGFAEMDRIAREAREAAAKDQEKEEESEEEESGS
jgi:hypothetical protein